MLHEWFGIMNKCPNQIKHFFLSPIRLFSLLFNQYESQFIHLWSSNTIFHLRISAYFPSISKHQIFTNIYTIPNLMLRCKFPPPPRFLSRFTPGNFKTCYLYCCYGNYDNIYHIHHNFVYTLSPLNKISTLTHGWKFIIWLIICIYMSLLHF